MPYFVMVRSESQVVELATSKEFPQRADAEKYAGSVNPGLRPFVVATIGQLNGVVVTHNGKTEVREVDYIEKIQGQPAQVFPKLLPGEVIARGIDGTIYIMDIGDQQ